MPEISIPPHVPPSPAELEAQVGDLQSQVRDLRGAIGVLETITAGQMAINASLTGADDPATYVANLRRLLLANITAPDDPLRAAAQLAIERICAVAERCVDEAPRAGQR